MEDWKSESLKEKKYERKEVWKKEKKEDAKPMEMTALLPGVKNVFGAWSHITLGFDLISFQKIA